MLQNSLEYGITKLVIFRQGGEMADAADSKSAVETREGSTPSPGTIKKFHPKNEYVRSCCVATRDPRQNPG